MSALIKTQKTPRTLLGAGALIAGLLLAGCDRSSTEPTPPPPPTATPAATKTPAPAPKISIDCPTWVVAIDFQAPADPAQATYILSDPDRLRIMGVIENAAPKKIDTSGMTVYYSASGSSVLGIPYSSSLQDAPPPNKPRYWKYFYQRGVIRQKTEVKNGAETIKTKVFYNDKSVPVLIAEPFGKWYSCYVLEYDAAGYLKRSTQVNFIRKFSAVTIHDPAPGYQSVVKHEFGFSDEACKIRARYRYSKEGSYSWSAKTGQEKRFSDKNFLDHLTAVTKFKLAPLLPIPGKK